MYLRTIRRRNADGSVVQYHQLAENVWDPDKRCAVAKVVHSFGRADRLDREALRRLAGSILRVFSGEEALAARPDVHILDSWPYGGAYVLETLWRELEIPRVIENQTRRQGTRQPFERALFAMVANRALAPYSKLYCQEQWLSEEVFFAGREGLRLQHLYRAMDFLEAHKEEIERAVFFRTAHLLNVDVDLIFYDTTSLHFEIDEEDEGAQVGSVLAGRKGYKALRRYGYSKNGRGDAPQIVVGLAVTRDGLPVRSWVFPGNTSDVSTVEKVKADLRGWRLNRCVFVGDAGMNSEQNRRTLALGGGKYILASRLRAGDEVSAKVLTRPGRYQKVAENLEVKEVVVGEGERRRRYVVCYNPEEAERQRRHREVVLDQLRQELASQRQPLRGGRHAKRTCELVTTERYKRYLRQTRRGLPKINRAAVAAEAKLDGKWVVTSNDDTLSAEDLALGYKQLLRVEQCWRTMKSGLKTRPVFHWRPHRISAHITLCVLALLLERIAEVRAGDTWRNIVAQLDTIKVVEYERGSARVRQTTEVRGAVAALMARLKVGTPPKIHAAGPKPATPTS
jgi:transposase